MFTENKSNKKIRRYSSGAGSKWTNRTFYDPWRLETAAAERSLSKKIEKSLGVGVFERPVHRDFIAPLKRHEVMSVLENLPATFKNGLSAIVLLGGTNKQRIASQRHLVYGCYTWNKLIFIHAFPKNRLVSSYRNAPRPNTLNEYRKAGARVTKAGRDIKVVFDQHSLRTFYLKEVLMHEIGHHVDRLNFKHKTDKKIEGFADWFASEFGYRNKGICNFRPRRRLESFSLRPATSRRQQYK